MLKRLRTGSVALGAMCVVMSACATMQARGPVDEKSFDRPIRLACVGDSITQGYGIRDPARNSYPSKSPFCSGRSGR